MKVLENERVVATPATVARPEIKTRPTAKPDIAVRGRLVRRPNPLIAACGRITVFGLAVGAVYVTSTLFGYVTLERARQSARHGMERASYARSEAKMAREGIETLTNPASLRSWADAHGFVATGTEPPTETKVARR